MPGPPDGRLLDEVIADLASAVTGAQQELDLATQRDALLWHEAVRGSNLPDELTAIIGPMMVNPMRISEVSIKTELNLDQRESRAFDAGLSLFARPVHSFYRSRFSATRTVNSRVEIVTVATRPRPSENESEPTTNDERTEK